MVTYSAAEAQDWIQRVEVAISFPSIPNNAERLPLSCYRSISPSNSPHRRGGGHAVRSTRFRPLSPW